MLNQTATPKYQTEIANFTFPSPPVVAEGYYLFIAGQKILELGKIFHFEIFQPKEKLMGWGLFKELKIEEEEIEAAKKSILLEKEF